MRHLRPQFAMLAGAFALAVLVSLFASTPAFYQKLSLAAHALVPTGLGAGHGMTVFDLTKPSLAAEFDWVARLVARLPVDPLAATGRISINVWRAGRLGVIDIADDGPGIPREHWENLFLAFRSKQRGGTGLGLAIARDLAVVQGGALKLTRSTEDGSEFRLQLPMEMFTSSR